MKRTERSEERTRGRKEQKKEEERRVINKEHGNREE